MRKRGGGEEEGEKETLLLCPHYQIEQQNARHVQQKWVTSAHKLALGPCHYLMDMTCYKSKMSQPFFFFFQCE